MFKLQKQPVYDIKMLENTTVLSLRDRGQPKRRKRMPTGGRFFPCVTGVNPEDCVTLVLRARFFPCVTGVNLRFA